MAIFNSFFYFYFYLSILCLHIGEQNLKEKGKHLIASGQPKLKFESHEYWWSFFLLNNLAKPWQETPHEYILYWTDFLMIASTVNGL